MPPNDRVAPTRAARMTLGKRIFQRMVLAVASVESPPLTSENISLMLIEDGPLAKAVRTLKIKTADKTRQTTGSLLVTEGNDRLPVLFCTGFS